MGPRATVLGPGHFLVMLHDRNTSTRAPRRGRHRPRVARDALARCRVGTQGSATAIRAVAPTGLVLVVGIGVEHERPLEAQLAPYLFDEYPEVDRRRGAGRSMADGEVVGPGAGGVRLLGRIVGPFHEVGTARR